MMSVGISDRSIERVGAYAQHDFEKI